jgi:hypothetical protein
MCITSLACLLYLSASAVSLAQNAQVASELYQKAHEQLVAAGFTDMVTKRFKEKRGAGLYEKLVLDDALKQKMTELSNAAAVMRQAAQLPLSGWQNTQDSQHLARIKAMSRDLSAFMTLQARIDLMQGNPQQAVDDLLSCLSYSNHIGQDGVLITKLVEVAVNRIVSMRVASHINELPEAALQSMLTKMNRLPPSSSPKKIYQAERDFALQLMAEQKEVYPPAMVEAIKVTYKDLLEFVDTSGSDFKESMKALSDKNANKPLAKTLIPAITLARSKMDVIPADHALLKAGINVVLNGKEGLDVVKDPHNGEPFLYEKTESGFKLTSHLKINETPISLEFGN